MVFLYLNKKLRSFYDADRVASVQCSDRKLKQILGESLWARGYFTTSRAVDLYHQKLDRLETFDALHMLSEAGSYSYYEQFIVLGNRLVALLEGFQELSKFYHDHYSRKDRDLVPYEAAGFHSLLTRAGNTIAQCGQCLVMVLYEMISPTQGIYNIDHMISALETELSEYTQAIKFP